MSSLKSVHALEDLLTVSNIPRSTFYYHAARLDEPEKHEALKARIVEEFTAHHRRYGHRKIRLRLHQSGWPVSRKLVWKLMRQMGLRSKVRRGRKYNSYQGTISHIAANVLARQFQTDQPNTKWVSDVTEFRVGQHKVYLSPVMDLYDHYIVSFATGKSPGTALTAGSLAEAFEREQPAPGLIVHTDQGVQYQHSSWRHILTENGAVQSMSRKGNCYDNAVMENFFGHLKAEMFHGEYFATAEELMEAIEEYIDWFNNERIQERLEGMTPMEYRSHALKLEAA